MARSLFRLCQPVRKTVATQRRCSYQGISSLHMSPSNERPPIFHGRSTGLNLSSLPSFQTRVQSTQMYGSIGGGINRAFPQYNVWGENCLLSFKPILPTFKHAGSDGVALDRRGRMLVEFAPQGPNGKHLWNDSIRFAMTVEEVGLCVSQLPQFAVELSRSGAGAAAAGDGTTNEAYGAVTETELPDKVLKAEPGEGASVRFSIDFIKDGVGGQTSGGKIGPLDVMVQAGEIEVVLSIFRETIPHLIGWNKLVSIGADSAMRDSLSGNKFTGGGPSSGGPSSGGPSYNVPF